MPSFVIDIWNETPNTLAGLQREDRRILQLASEDDPRSLLPSVGSLDLYRDHPLVSLGSLEEEKEQPLTGDNKPKSRVWENFHPFWDLLDCWQTLDSFDGAGIEWPIISLSVSKLADFDGCFPESSAIDRHWWSEKSVRVKLSTIFVWPVFFQMFQIHVFMCFKLKLNWHFSI